MADNSIGALNVQLSLDATQFTNSVADINRRMRVVRTQFEATSDGTREYAQSLEGLRNRSTMLTRTMALQNAKVEELRRRYEQTRQATGENSRATQDAQIAYNRAQAAMNRTQAQLRQVTEALAEQTDQSKKAQKALNEFSEKAKDIGGKMSSTVTPAILAVGAGLIKIADDAEGSTTRIQRTLGISATEAKKYSKIVRSLYENNFGDNIEEVETALLQVNQQMKGLNDADLQKITGNAMYLAETFDADVNEVVRAGDNLMKGFGSTSEEAFDLMAWGAQNGLNFSNEMFDNLAEYSPLYKDMGFSAQEYFQLLAQGSESGVYNLDYINDAMKEFQIRTKDGSKATTEAMGQMSESTQKVFDNFLNGKATVKDLHNAVIADLSSMDDQVKANELGVAVYGTKWEDMEKDTMYSLGNITGGLEGVKGAMDRTGDAVELTFGEKAKVAWRKAQNDLIPLGEKLLGIAEDILPKVTGAIDSSIEAWNSLSPTTQDLMLGLAGVAAIAGPVILGIGSIAGALSGLVGFAGTAAAALGIGGAGAGAAAGVGLTASAGGLGAALTALTGPVGLAIGAVAALGIGAIALDKKMDKPIIKSQIFSDEISKSTQEAVGSYLKLDEDASEALSQLAWSQETITDEMAKSLTSKYAAMNTAILDSMKKRHSDEITAQKDLFAKSSALTAEEEAKATLALEEGHAYKERKQQEYNDRILEIITTAKNEKRSVTQAEQMEINGLQEKMRTNAVKTMSKSEEEQVMILGRLKNQAGIISAEQAADVVANSEKQRKKTVKEAEKQYNETVKQIEYMRDVTGEITADQANRMIDEATRTKNVTVRRANEMHKDVVGSAKTQAGEHADQVNWETGKVLSGWDKMYNGIVKAINWVRDIFGVKNIKLRGSVDTTKWEKTGQSKITNGKKAVYLAKGTANGQHAGGPAIVGEEGPEMGYIPNHGYTLLGAHGPEFLSNLPRGSSVLPNKHTEKILKQYGFPAYKDGVGNWDVFDILTKGATGAWNMLKSKFSIGNKLLPSTFRSGLDVDVVGEFGGMATNYLKSLFDGFMGGDGGAGNVKAKFGNLRKTSSFGMRFHPIDKVWKLHAGDDYKGPIGTAIRATTGGRVVRSGPSGTGWGTMVKIQNGAYSYIYAHLSKAIAKLGSTISKGSILGLLGSTGKSTGPHLHYEVHKNGRPIRPNAYAKGGFINNEQLAMIGEGGKREVVIPLERFSERARALWQQAGVELGMINMPKPSQMSPMTSTTGVGASYTVTNHYEINIDANIANDMDIDEVAKKIQKSIERQQKLDSRSQGVV